jgi:hypothetical protein
MPDIKIIKLKIRRGTDAQRKAVIIEQGELGYTIDTQRVFVGDGATLGGNTVANIIHAPLNSVGARAGITRAVTGDLVYENKLLYQLSGTDYSKLSAWGFVGTRADESSLTYSNNNLIIKNNGITGNKFATTATYQYGGIVAHPTLGLSASVDNSTLTVTTTNKLSVGQIDQRHISSSTFEQGIAGGNGTTVSINADSTFFGFDEYNQLTLTAIPNNSVTLNKIDGSVLGPGLLSAGSQITTVLQDVDNATLAKSSGIVSIKPLHGGDIANFSNFTYNSYGQITSITDTITETLCSNQTSTSILSVFNGSLDQDTFTNQTLIPVISSNGITTETITLTSAGYVFLDTGIYGRIAIPVLNY